jgi:hypothetical protein
VTDLLPIIFARGQSEGIDPRVAPPDVHVAAVNVRWRKDGRPAKRYGITQISNTGLNGGGRTYTGNPVNAIGSWNGTPIFALGSGVRQLQGSTWTDAITANASEISHWSPGRHDPIARADQSLYQNASVGYSSGVLLYVWDDGTNLIASAKSVTGVVLAAPSVIGSGSFVRCISTTNLIYMLYAPVGSTTLNCTTFDPATLLIGATVSLGTLNAVGNFYDAQGRGTEFLIIYQSAASTLTVKLVSAIASPNRYANADRCHDSGAGREDDGCELAHECRICGLGRGDERESRIRRVQQRTHSFDDRPNERRDEREQCRPARTGHRREHGRRAILEWVRRDAGTD